MTANDDDDDGVSRCKAEAILSVAVPEAEVPLSAQQAILESTLRSAGLLFPTVMAE